MGFDDFIDDFNEPEKIDATPAIVSETIAFGNELIKQDFLPKLMRIKILEKYIVGLKHLNLYKLGWRFQFGTSKEWAGLCSAEESNINKSKDRNVYVSIDFVKHEKNWQKNMSETVHHELAHAIVFEIFYFAGLHRELLLLDPSHQLTQGHGLIWGEVCKNLFGDTCNMYYMDAKFDEKFKKYRYECVNCDHIEFSNNKGFTEYCTKCGKPVFVQVNHE
jgi:predicted SprT family Zn-dependent metalloprotease